MSIILDALKKAQEERKRITQMAFPKSGTSSSTGKQKWAFYGVAGGLVCLIIAVILYPSPKKQAQMQTPASNPPVTATAPRKIETEPNAEVKAIPKKKKKTAIQPKTESPVYPVPTASTETKQQPETEKKTAAYVPKRKLPPKPQTQDTQKTSLTQESTQVVVKKVDDEKILCLFNEAVEETKNGRFEVAKDLYKTILEEKPDHIEAINNIGVIEMERGDLKEALTYFRRCLGYKKDYAKAFNNIGLVMMNQGNLNGAEEYFRKSIEIDKNKIEPYLNLTAIMRGEKRYDEASSLLEPLLDRQIRDASLYLSLALIKDETGKYSDAIRYYRYYLNSGGNGKSRNTVINRLKILEENQVKKQK